MSTTTATRCATIGCTNGATVRIAYGPWDDRAWDDCCEGCADGYTRRPALRAERIGAPFVCPREGVARGYFRTVRGGSGTGPGRAFRMGDPGGVEVRECQQCGATVAQ